MKPQNTRFRQVWMAAMAIILFSYNGYSQNGVAINTTNAASHSSAILDVSSTSKGALMPRMTAAGRAAIASPATGLTVYQTDGTAGYYYYNGTAWIRMGSVADMSGILPVSNGGTGAGSLTANGVLYGNGTGTVQVTAASTAANSFLTTATAGAAPSWTVPQVPLFVTLQNTLSGLNNTKAFAIGGAVEWDLGSGWTPATAVNYEVLTAAGTSEYRTNKAITLNNLRLTGWIQNESGNGTGNITIHLVKYALGAVTSIANNNITGTGGTSLGSVTVNMANAKTSYLFDLNIGTVPLVQGDVIIPVVYNAGGGNRNLYTNGKMAWTVDLGTVLN